MCLSLCAYVLFNTGGHTSQPKIQKILNKPKNYAKIYAREGFLNILKTNKMFGQKLQSLSLHQKNGSKGVDKIWARNNPFYSLYHGFYNIVVIIIYTIHINVLTTVFSRINYILRQHFFKSALRPLNIMSPDKS